MAGKVNFDDLTLDEDQNILNEEIRPKIKKVRKPDGEKLTAQIRVNLKPREKEQLEKIAGWNFSAFVRDILIKHGYIKGDKDN